MARTRQTPDTSLCFADIGNKTAYATRHLLPFSSRQQTPRKLISAHNLNPNMAVSHSRRISHGGLKFPTSYRTLIPSPNKSYPNTNKPSEPSCSLYPYLLPHVTLSQPLLPKILVPSPHTPHDLITKSLPTSPVSNSPLKPPTTPTTHANCFPTPPPNLPPTSRQLHRKGLGSLQPRPL